MKPTPFDSQQSDRVAPVLWKIRAPLVFDDDPVEPMLEGSQPAEPTPASVLDAWRHGLGRSEACRRALGAVLAQNPNLVSPGDDLADAEACLRLTVESCPSSDGLKRAASFASLGQVLELKKQAAEAETFYREAFGLQEKLLGPCHEVTCATGMRLVNLLELSDRREEAADLSSRLKPIRQSAREDDWHSLALRSMARELFAMGHYAEAETIYLRLIEKCFAPGSTRCHLARLYLRMDRATDARHQVALAWAARCQSGAYVITRIHYLKTLLLMIAGEDFAASLIELKHSLSDPGSEAEWDIQPVLDHLKPRLKPEHWDLLTAVAAAINDRTQLVYLELNSIW
jgi:tetratricopeptide (TPR) repeat protein